MCRLFFITGENKNLSKKVALKMIEKSYDRYNRDGFFFLSIDKYVRTLIYNQFVNELIKSESNNYFVHLRQATHGEDYLDNIHGWEFSILGEMFYCAHNGVVELKHEYDKKMSDSWNFFRYLENTETLEKMKEKIEENYISGEGIFMLVNRDFSKLLLITINEEAYAQDLYFNNDIVSIISSKEDVLLSKNDKKIKITE